MKKEQLLAEYKDKNDSLTGMVTKYQGYAEKNKQLNVAFLHRIQRQSNRLHEHNEAISDF